LRGSNSWRKGDAGERGNDPQIVPGSLQWRSFCETEVRPVLGAAATVLVRPKDRGKLAHGRGAACYGGVLRPNV
jgi:hypothetical protein